MAWNLALTQLMNEVANSATSALKVEVVAMSTGSLPVCATITGTVGISSGTTDAFAISVYGGGSLPVSATDLDVDIPDIIGISTSDVIGVSAGTVTPFTVSGDVGIDAYDSVVAGMTSAVAASTAYSLPSQACKSVAVHADDDNTGEIFIGGSAVAGDGANGYRLNAGQSISLRLSNVNLIYYSAPNASDKIYWIVIN